MSVTKKSLVVQSAPQKPYHPYPVQDSKRCGFGGLLSRPAVHAASRDEEDRSSSAVFRNRWREEEVVLVRLFERSNLPFMAQEKEARGQRREVKQRDEDEANNQQLKGSTVRI